MAETAFVLAIVVFLNMAQLVQDIQRHIAKKPDFSYAHFADDSVSLVPPDCICCHSYPRNLHLRVNSYSAIRFNGSRAAERWQNQRCDSAFDPL